MSPIEPSTWKPYINEDGTPSAQAKILACGAFEACVGGVVGAGKTGSLLAGPLRWVDRPGFAAAIFRRNYTDLTKADGLIERAANMWRSVGGESHNGGIAWTWPSGARIDLAGMDREEDRFKYDGSAYQYCVARGTPVLMADGSWRPIERIDVGALVATPIGPRRVTRTHDTGRKPVFSVRTPWGSTLVGERHRVLASSGWVYPAEGRPTRCRESETARTSCRRPSRGDVPLPPVRSAGLERDPSLGEQPPLEIDRLVIAASSADARTGCAASDCERQAEPLPASWSAHLVLYGPALRSGETGSRPALPAHDEAHARAETSREGWPIGCRGECGSRGERPRRDAEDDRDDTRPPTDVAAAAPTDSREGGLGCTRSRIRSSSRRLLHPYSSEPLVAVVAMFEAECEVAPEGEADTLDLTVEGASQYVTWGGIISANCGFDQLETFTKRQYTYMASRMRQNDRILATGAPIPLRLRSSATPGGPNPEWVVEHFAPWIRAKDSTWTGYRARDGERVFYRFDERKNEQVMCREGDPGARSRCYFATELLEALVGAEYRAALDTLDPLTRAQRLYGDWLIRPGAGLFFTAESFSFVDHGPIRARARCRAWDLASTPKKPLEAEGQGAASAGVKMSLDGNGEVYIEDVKHLWELPSDVEDMVCDTCFADDEDHGEPVLVSLPLDPGQASRHQRDAYARRLSGRYWRMTPEVGEKTNRIKPLSAHASRSPIRLVRGPWNDAFIRELIAFPYGRKDQGDAASRAYAECLRMPAVVASRDAARPPQRPTARGFGRF